MLKTVPVKVEVSTANEGTCAPYWLIIDPRQMMKPDAGQVSAMIDGPFFSRQEAERYLREHRHNYSDKTVVWCASGCKSKQYTTACYEAGIH